MTNLWKTQARKFLSRRQQDVRDQCQEYMTSTANVDLTSPEAVEKQRRTAEREARRSRRRRAREMKDIVGHHDGLSSDDEENQSEIAKYNVEKGGTFTHNPLCWQMTLKCSIIRYDTAQ